MHDSNLANVDLNLLVALRALLTERHVTRAGRSLGLSQSAMSRSLARLRTLFGDPLLVPTSQGLGLTTRAEELDRSLDSVLDRVSELVRGSTFDPAQATGEVSIAASDIIAWQLLPHVLEDVLSAAPGLTLRVNPWRSDWREQLESGDNVLTIGWPSGNEAGIYQHDLLTTQWACVLREGHPSLDEPWTPKLYAGLPHLLISTGGRGGGHGQVDEALASIGLRRHVALRIPFIVVSPLLVAESDLVLTTSRWLAMKFAQQVPLVIREPPVDLAPVRLPMVWHERTHRDPRARWIRSLMVEAAGRIDPNMLAASPEGTVGATTAARV